MAANTTPIFGLVPLLGFSTITAANAATDGTGVVATLVTMGANGGRLDRIRLVALGTNVQSKAYVFLNNGQTPTVAANNALALDIPLLATTASNVNLIGWAIDIPLGWVLPAGTVILATLATAVAAGWNIKAFGVSF